MNKKTIQMYFGSPLYQAFFPVNIADSGMGSVVLARKTMTGAIVGVDFLCDHYCLGVKDCFPFYYDYAGYRDFLLKIGSREELQESTPGYVKKYILDLVAWSKSLGFFPHPDYRTCSEILSGFTADEDATFQFGKDGVPFYINGPYDTPQRVKSIINTLESYKARTGNEAYYLMVAEPDSALMDNISHLTELTGPR